MSLIGPGGQAPPTFSVIVPAHNAAATIDRCLGGIERQRVADYEVIVVDDGSADQTSAHVRNHAGVRLISQAQQGPCAARNAGLRASSGRYVTFLDADDEVEEDWLWALAAELRNEPTAVVVSCGVHLIERTGTDQQRTRIQLPKRLGPAFGNLDALFLPGAYAVDRRALLAIGGFTEGLPYGEHSELALRLAAWAEEHHAQAARTDRVLIIKHHDRTPGRVTSYDTARRRGAEYKLAHHEDRLRRDPRLAADYHGVAGVACMRLGERREAQRHFRKALWLRPSRKNALRLAVALVPGVVPRRWRPNAQ